MPFEANTTVIATKEVLKARGFRVVATVQESPGVTDLALELGPDCAFIVRCSDRTSAADYRALATMVAQGDFARAALVYTDEDQPHVSGEIEAYHISRIDELAASLARESAP